MSESTDFPSDLVAWWVNTDNVDCGDEIRVQYHSRTTGKFTDKWVFIKKIQPFMLEVMVSAYGPGACKEAVVPAEILKMQDIKVIEIKKREQPILQTIGKGWSRKSPRGGGPSSPNHHN
ncbi:hypothetical protein H4R33_005087, partial [Dimargaris cristalligena]